MLLPLRFWNTCELSFFQPMIVNTIIKVRTSEDLLFYFCLYEFTEGLLSNSFPVIRSHFPKELGDGPFSLVSAVVNDTMFGVNRTSSSVFPLIRERPGQLPAPGILFNFMITAGLWRNKTSREHLPSQKNNRFFFLGKGRNDQYFLIFSGVPLVSLESAERPNYFLTVSGRSRLQLEQWSRGPEFGRRATFIQHQGLFLTGYASFELVSQPGIFLTLTRGVARAQRYGTSEGFKASSSFTLEGQKYKHNSCTEALKCFWTMPANLFFIHIIWRSVTFLNRLIWQKKLVLFFILFYFFIFWKVVNLQPKMAWIL